MDRLVGKLPATPVAATPTPAVTRAAVTETPAVAVQALPTASTATALPVAASAATPSAASPAARALGGILLQVASFSSRDNAARALGQLSSAGIAGASLSDVVSGGRTLWRLRVNADDLTSATELAGRIAGLGFGKPQIVRD